MYVYVVWLLHISYDCSCFMMSATTISRKMFTIWYKWQTQTEEVRTFKQYVAMFSHRFPWHYCVADNKLTTEVCACCRIWWPHRQHLSTVSRPGFHAKLHGMGRHVPAPAWLGLWLAWRVALVLLHKQHARMVLYGTVVTFNPNKHA